MDGLIRSRTASYVCRRCSRRPVLRQWRRDLTGSSAATTTTPEIYDLACVGGGPVGLSLLTALRTNPATSHLRTVLVEAQDLAKARSWHLPPDQYANRCISLTPATTLFLDSIGAWAHLARERVQDYGEMQVWDGVSDARIELAWPSDNGSASTSASGPAAAGAIAYMVEIPNLASALLRRLDELGGVDVLDRSAVRTITSGEDAAAAANSDKAANDAGSLDLSQWPVVHLDGGRQLAARLLVGADGANSPVRAFAGITSRGWDYDAHGVVATLEMEGEDGGGGDYHYYAGNGRARKTAYQRFLPTGPVALLPLPGRRATLVWSTTPANARLLKALAPLDLVAMLNAVFRLSPVDLAYLHTLRPSSSASEGGGDGEVADEVAWRLLQYYQQKGQQQQQQQNPRTLPNLPPAVVGVQPGSIASFPLRMRHADTYAGERVALAGDAAHSTHPLAGQGLNLGMQDAAALARCIAAEVRYGQDIGAPLALEGYVAERYAANHVMLGVTDKLHKLYSVGWGPLVPLRSWGVGAVDALGPLKRWIMSRAAGG